MLCKGTEGTEGSFGVIGLVLGLLLVLLVTALAATQLDDAEPSANRRFQRVFDVGAFGVEHDAAARRDEHIRQRSPQRAPPERRRGDDAFAF